MNNGVQPCNHSSIPREQLMICVNRTCQQPSKIGCRLCFLQQHLHDDIIQLKAQYQLDLKLQPFLTVSKRRQQLQQQARCAISLRRKRMQQILDRQQKHLDQQIQKIFPKALSQTVLSISNGVFSELQLIEDIFEERRVMTGEQQLEIERDFGGLSQYIEKWKNSQIGDGAVPGKRAREFVMPEEVVVQGAVVSAVNPGKKVKLAKAANGGGQHHQSAFTNMGPAAILQTSQAGTIVQSQQTSSSNSTQPINKCPQHIVDSFDKAVDYLTQNQNSQSINLTITNPKPTDRSQVPQHNLGKFMNQLKILQKVEYFTLKIGDSATLLLQWMLEKIDSIIGRLPQLKYFSFYGFTEVPQKFDFPEVRGRIGREDMVQIVIRKK